MCTFYEMNGKHCVIDSMCIVCKEPQPPELKMGEQIVLQNFGNLDGTYRIRNIKAGILSLELVK